MVDVLSQLRERAKRRRARIVLPETLDPRTVSARAMLERDRLCQELTALIEETARHASRLLNSTPLQGA